MNRSLLALAAALTVVPATSASALTSVGDVRYSGASTDGSHIYVHTDQRLAAGDVNDATDIYDLSGGQVSLVTPGTQAESISSVLAVDDGGSVVFFSSSDRLTPDDTDDTEDVYARTPGGLRKITPSNGVSDETLAGRSADGAFAYVQTPAQLTGADLDDKLDVYEIATATGATRLISTQTPTQNAMFVGAGGTIVFFMTTEAIVGADTDTTGDVYYRISEFEPQLATGGTANATVHPKGVAADGGRLLFTTTESLDPADADTMADVYESGPSGIELRSPSPNNAAAAKTVTFRAMSSDGVRVIFDTAESLTGLDGDAATDLYANQGTTNTLLSGNGTATVQFEAASASAAAVVFSTTAKLLGTDTDSVADIYRASAVGTVTHLVQTNGAFVQQHVHISPNGNIIGFDTDEPIAATDTDTMRDTYVRNAGGVQHASVPFGEPWQPSTLDTVTGAGVAVFGSYDRLSADDADDTYDVFTFLGSATTKVSPDPLPAPPAEPPAEQPAGTTDAPAGTSTPVVAGESSTSPAVADRTAPLIGQPRTTRRGTRLAVRFVMSEAAAVRVVVQRRAGGRWTRVKAKALAGHLGRHTVRLRVKGLRPGMRVVVTARDLAGNRARPARVRVR